MISVFTAYLLIPLYTLLFVYGTDWFSTNLSVIGSWPEMRDGFVFLGLLLLAYYCGALRRLLRYLPRRRLETGMAGMAAFGLFLAVATPYLPKTVPLQARLHVVSAFASAVLLLAVLYRVVWRLSGRSGAARRGLRLYRIGLILVTAGCALLFWLAGIISSAMEVFFILSLTVWTQKLSGRIRCIFPESD